MPAEIFLFIPFWKLKVMEKCVIRSNKKRQSANTLQILWIVKTKSIAIWLLSAYTFAAINKGKTIKRRFDEFNG